jgi:fluoroquinolone resistance protein
MVIDDDSQFYMKKFRHLNLAKRTLTGITFEECDFRSCELPDVTLVNCNFLNCGFVDCNLANVRVPGSRFHNVSFSDSKVTGVDWDKAAWPTLPQFPHLQFHQCVVSNSSFHGLSLEGLVLVECTAHEVDFRDGNFSRGNFTHSDLARSRFSKTCLTEADFTDALNYDVDVRNNEIRWSKFSRIQAVRLLYSFEIELVD